MADVSIKYKGTAIAELNDSGTKSIKTSGKYCEDNITVEYVKPQAESGGGSSEPINCKILTFEVTSKISGKWGDKLIPADADIAAHRSDDTFGVAWNCLTAVSAAISTRGGIYTNAPMAWNSADGSSIIYGYYIRTGSNGAGANARLTNLPTVKTTAAGCIFVDTDGSISFYASSSYPILPGTYQVVVWW